MGTAMLQELNSLDNLVKAAHASDEPLLVMDGVDECLIVMRPVVFERILFDTNILNCSGRESLHV